MTVKHLLAVLTTGLLLTACESTKSGSDMNADANAAAHGAPGSEQDFRASVNDRVLFAFDSSAVTAEGRAILDAQAKWMEKYPNAKFMIEGHCDKRGTREYNLALGARRAQSIKDYLATKGIGEARVQTVSYGKEKLEFLGDTEADHSKNRRGVSVVQ